MEIKLPEYKEIPDVGLYLDQVTKFINQYLLLNHCNEVTPSMISNYVKLKIVPKATKKMYSRDQIALFIFIALSKSILSMDQIRYCFEIQNGISSIEKAYSYFRSIMISETVESFSKISDDYKLITMITSAIKQKLLINEYLENREKND